MSSGRYDAHTERMIAEIYKLLDLVEFGEDYDAALAATVVYAQSPDPSLRMNALHCFGHIARVYGKLDLGVALPLIREGEKDVVPDVAAAARDALDDMEMFLPGFDRLRAGEDAAGTSRAA